MNIVAIDKSSHRDIKISQDKTFAKAKQQNFTLLQAHEFFVAASYYPIVFIKDIETGELHPIALFGLQENENLFFDETGWKGYTPAALRAHPFTLAPKSHGSLLSLCIDTNSPLVSSEAGESLFDHKGEETAYLTQVKEFMSTLISQTPATEAFTQHLLNKNLLQPFSFSVSAEENGQKPYSVSGIYAIDDRTLNSLPDIEFQELHKRGYLPAIYAHLISLNLMSVLAQKKAAKQKI